MVEKRKCGATNYVASKNRLYACSLLSGHGDRHMAVDSDGITLLSWSQKSKCAGTDDPTKCSSCKAATRGRLAGELTIEMLTKAWNTLLDISQLKVACTPPPLVHKKRKRQDAYNCGRIAGATEMSAAFRDAIGKLFGVLKAQEVSDGKAKTAAERVSAADVG